MEEFTNLQDHITSQAKATADDVKRNHDEELKDFKNDIIDKFKVLGVIKVKGLQNMIFHISRNLVNTLKRSL